MRFSLFLACVAVFGCGPEVVVQRVNPEAATDLSDHWNDTDAHETARALIEDCLRNSQWVDRFRAAHPDHSPTVRVYYVSNKTSEHIDAHLFTEDLERALE